MSGCGSSSSPIALSNAGGNGPNPGAAARQISRVSVSLTDGDADNQSLCPPAISSDGRFVVFHSLASNLVISDTNAALDVFVRDRVLNRTSIVSVDSIGNRGNAASSLGLPESLKAISDDGRFVVFQSDATNLVVNDTNAETDIFVHDLQTGITSRASVSSNGTASNGFSRGACISGNGRFVGFVSSATNLVTGDTNNVADIFIHDRQTATTTLVSVDSSGTQANDISSLGGISDDGRLVVFRSDATNLVTGDTNNSTDVFLRDRQNNTTTRVSLDSAGVQANAACVSPQISGDGRVVAFTSGATNLITGDSNAVDDIFLRDLQANSTTRVSLSSTGQAPNANCGRCTLSREGRWVAFDSSADNLVNGDTNTVSDIFVRDRQANTTTRVNLNVSGEQADRDSGFCSISSNGLAVAFISLATNLVSNDANGFVDVYFGQP